jgi:hypothetical protein
MLVGASAGDPCRAGSEAGGGAKTEADSLAEADHAPELILVSTSEVRMDRKELITSRQTQVVQATKSEALERTEGTAMRDSQLELEERLQKRFKKAVGTDRLDLAESLIGQANLLAQRWTGTSVTRALTMALQILEEIKPR